MLELMDNQLNYFKFVGENICRMYVSDERFLDKCTMFNLQDAGSRVLYF